MRFRARMTLAVGAALVVLSVFASTPAFAQSSPDPAHPARHGIVWKRGAGAPAASTTELAYGGGNSGIGVTTGAPQVYVVFWGSQWGTSSTNSSGYLTFSNDPGGMAPYYQAFVAGLGTGGELWSGVMTQYCESVAAGTITCPSGNTSHVGYPTGGALSGVWYDNSSSAPSQATQNQLAQEAVNTATHFSNTTSSLNRNAQYVVISPTGTHPDGYNTLFSNWCAWHDYSSDPALTGGPATSSFGGVAFTNLPYIPDTGASCGANFNNLGSQAGITIVGGHEYAETITDQFPAGGWTDSSGSENGDKCAWISSGQGAAQDITLGTGSFPVQSTWANDFNSGAGGCEVSHPIVTDGTTTNDFSIGVSPSSQTVTAGGGTSYTVSTAVTSGSASSVTLSASGLPSGASAGFSPNPVTAGGSSTMSVTTTSSTPAGTYTITVTGNNGSATHSATTGLTVNAQAGSNPVVNGGFETGTLSGWTGSGPAYGVSTHAHSGSYSAILGKARRTSGSSSIAQTFTLPGGVTTLSFYYQGVCPSSDTPGVAWASAALTDNTTGTPYTLLSPTCTNTGSWVQVTFSVSALVGHSVTLTLTSHDDNDRGDYNYTYFDDVMVS